MCRVWVEGCGEEDLWPARTHPPSSAAAPGRTDFPSPVLRSGSSNLSEPAGEGTLGAWPGLRHRHHTHAPTRGASAPTASAAPVATPTLDAPLAAGVVVALPEGIAGALLLPEGEGVALVSPEGGTAPKDRADTCGW